MGRTTTEPVRTAYGDQPMQPRVGFLGTGWIAQFHAYLLTTSDEPFDKGPVFDTDAERAARFAADWGFSAVSTEEEVLEDCDAVYVTTWTAEHERLVHAAAERGRAVFCEKPLAFDAAAAERMATAVERAGVVNQVGLVLRHSPAFALLRSLIADPAAGRLMTIIFRDDQFLPTRGYYGSTWRGDRALAGAGTLLEHSIHDVDLIEWLAGPAETVSCHTSSFHGLEGIEDLAALTLTFAGGATAQLTSVWHDIDERGSLRFVEVFCERLWMCLEGDWEGPVRWQFTGAEANALQGAELEAEARRRGARLGNPDGAFVRAVAAGRPAWPTLRDAVRPHQIVDAAYASAAQGGAVVSLPPD